MKKVRLGQIFKAKEGSIYYGATWKCINVRNGKFQEMSNPKDCIEDPVHSFIRDWEESDWIDVTKEYEVNEEVKDLLK